MTASSGGPVQDSSNVDSDGPVTEDEVAGVSGESLGSDHSPERSVHDGAAGVEPVGDVPQNGRVAGDGAPVEVGTRESDEAEQRAAIAEPVGSAAPEGASSPDDSLDTTPDLDAAAGGEGPGRVRVLVTGSRTWTDRDAVWRALDEVLAEHPNEAVVVVHGAATRGADRHAADWVRDLEYAGGTVTAEPHPADWKGDGKAAGPRRNLRMVAAGADLCLTFIERCPCPQRRESHGTHGSVHCATAAAKAGIPVRHVTTQEGT